MCCHKQGVCLADLIRYLTLIRAGTVQTEQASSEPAKTQKAVVKDSKAPEAAANHKAALSIPQIAANEDDKSTHLAEVISAKSTEISEEKVVRVNSA